MAVREGPGGRTNARGTGLRQRGAARRQGGLLAPHPLARHAGLTARSSCLSRRDVPHRARGRWVGPTWTTRSWSSCVRSGPGCQRLPQLPPTARAKRGALRRRRDTQRRGCRGVAREVASDRRSRRCWRRWRRRWRRARARLWSGLGSGLEGRMRRTCRHVLWPRRRRAVRPRQLPQQRGPSACRAGQGRSAARIRAGPPRLRRRRAARRRARESATRRRRRWRRRVRPSCGCCCTCRGIRRRCGGCRRPVCSPAARLERGTARAAEAPPRVARRTAGCEASGRGTAGSGKQGCGRVCVRWGSGERRGAERTLRRIGSCRSRGEPLRGTVGVAFGALLSPRPTCQGLRSAGLRRLVGTCSDRDFGVPALQLVLLVCISMPLMRVP
jgi:hypothetical protein